MFYHTPVLRIMFWIIVILVLILPLYYVVWMPGVSYRGSLPPLTDEQKEVKSRLKEHVRMLAGVIGERNVTRYGSLKKAAGYIDETFHKLGYSPLSQTYYYRDKEVRNIEVEIKGRASPEEIVVIGAHYDSAPGSPGANDNATGTAAVLELSRLLRDFKPARTLRFVAFVNEEPPFFMTEYQGSYVYARRSKELSEHITAMLSIETIGYYSDKKATQKYPPPLSFFYPTTADFIGFVGNLSSRSLVHSCISAFRRSASFPSEGASSPSFIEGVDWSDHRSFWQMGYKAVMVTDTALFRYDYYHTPQDTPDKINFESAARVVDGLRHVAIELAGTGG